MLSAGPGPSQDRDWAWAFERVRARGIRRARTSEPPRKRAGGTAAEELRNIGGFVGPAAVRAELAGRAVEETFAGGTFVALQVPVQPRQIDQIEVASGLKEISSVTGARLREVHGRDTPLDDLVVVAEAVLVGNVVGATVHDFERCVHLVVEAGVRTHQPAAGDTDRGEARIAGYVLGHQATAREAVGGDLRRLEALVVGAAGLVVLGDGPGDVVEERFSVLPTGASVGAAGSSVGDDEIAPGGDLTHGCLIRKSVLRATALSPNQNRILLVAEILGPEDGAALDAGLRVRLDDDLVRPAAGHALARALGRGAGARELSAAPATLAAARSEEHTSELQSQSNLVCRLLLEKKKKQSAPLLA